MCIKTNPGRWLAAISITALGGVVARIPFVLINQVPHFPQFDPGIFLVPLGGVIWGPAGACGSCVGSLLGDWLFGVLSPLSLFRALGMLFFALGTKIILEMCITLGLLNSGLRQDWYHALSFFVLTLPGCLLSACWPAVGAEILKYYPFAYFATLLLLNNLISCALFGVFFYRVAVRWIMPWVGAIEVKKRRFAWVGVVVPTASVLAYVVGVWVSIRFYRFDFIQPIMFGQGTGFGVVAAVAPFLVMQAVAVCWRARA